MPDDILAGRRVLVVEDEYFLADELDHALRASGATVAGPVSTVEAALALLADFVLPDLATVDVNLGGEMAYPVADALVAHGVPFLFTTGYDQASLPHRYASAPRMEKPFDTRKVLQELGRLHTERAAARSHRPPTHSPSGSVP